MELIIGSLLMDTTVAMVKMNDIPLNDKLLKIRATNISLKHSNTEAKDRFYINKRGRDVREQYIRILTQKLTGYRCWSCRPSWLVSPKTGRRLELDIYIPELKVA